MKENLVSVRLLTVDDVAKMLQVTRYWVEARARRGLIPRAIEKPQRFAPSVIEGIFFSHSQPKKRSLKIESVKPKKSKHKRLKESLWQD